CMLLSLVSLNITRGSGPLFFYRRAISSMIVVGALLSSVFTAAIGVFVSLRAPTARAAAQVFNVVTLALFVGGSFLVQALPASAKDALFQMLSTVNWNLVGIATALIVLVLDIVLLALGIARFQRTRLIL
ncbi:MAG: hypothetical protein ACPLRM_02540, partial [Anaerolineae bacterium]